MSEPQQFEKRPEANFTIAIDFTGRIPEGTSLDSASVQATDPSGTDVTATVIQGPSGTVVGDVLMIRVRAGDVGSCYEIVALASLDDGVSVIPVVIHMRVVEYPSN